MTERLLQFIWQFQYFQAGGLTAVSGEPLEVILPGQHNTNQGPDFSNARVRIGGIEWAGAVELHIRTSDWQKHHHQHDRHYRNVILHVVWEHDQPANAIPVLELRTRISRFLLERYEALMNSPAFIPCGTGISQLPLLNWKSWKERLLAERLIRKAGIIQVCLQENNYHWEETFWWLLARNFGIKVNADAFEAIARSIPFTVLGREKSRLHHLEALLMGQAGLLNATFLEPYPRLLQKVYAFLCAKYRLQPVQSPVYFLRMRPGNFPTVRLAQLAALLHTGSHLFSSVKEAATLHDVIKLLSVTAGTYWHHHYRFDECLAPKPKKLGTAMVSNIVVNTVVPVLFTCALHYRDERYREKALQWLEETAAEENSLTRGFRGLDTGNNSAYDSQALTELKTRYCDRRRCLECAVGNYLLKGSDKTISCKTAEPNSFGEFFL